MKCCEVRIPTYNRPELLQRAIKSLISQDYSNWKAIIFDDSMNNEVKILIDNFNDSRIIYKSNNHNIGASRNINQCFQTSGYLDGAYAFVLEDDNYIEPNFISENIKELVKNNINILLRNQNIENFKCLNDIEITNKTTLGFWFENRIYSPQELHSFLFFMQGISNGGLFWRTIAKSNLVVEETSDVGLQENFRCFHIIEPLFFAEKPLAVYTYMETHMTARRNNNGRIYSRGRQNIVRRIIKKYGSSVVFGASEIARTKDLEIVFEKTLLDAFYFNYSFKISTKVIVVTTVYAFARFFYLNRVKDFFA